MRKQTIIDVVPMNHNGKVIYMETHLRGLGATTAFVNTASNITNVVNAANAAIPNQKVTVQSDFSKTANVVATGAAVVAAATVWFPPAAIVAGIVSAAAALLGKIFANSKAKGYAAERGQWEQVNSQIKFENAELDKQYASLDNAIQQLKNGISSLSGLPIQGLGICWGNCKDEKEKLKSAQGENEALTLEQKNKTEIMISLLNEYNKLMKELINLKSDKSTKDWLLWILLGAVVVGGGVYVYTKSK